MIKGIALLFMATLILSLISCSKESFHSGVLASTSSEAVPDYQVIDTVYVERCSRAFAYLFIPADYKEMYDIILADAVEAGGDAVVDFQMKSTSFTFVYPFFFTDCWAATGKAVKFNSQSLWSSDSAGVIADSLKNQKMNVYKSPWDVD